MDAASGVSGRWWRRRDVRVLLTAILAGALVGACGAPGVESADGSAAPEASGSAPPGFPVTIDNCGVTTTYDAPPKRAVTMNQNATEIMLALGLADSMVGTAWLDDTVLPAYAHDYRTVPVLAEEYPSFEKLVGTGADFVYGGFDSAFDAKEGRSRRMLTNAGIDTHLNSEACADRATMATVDGEVRTLGKIFGVRGRAERLVERFHRTLDDTAAKLAGVSPLTVFVYDSGTKTALTAGGKSIGTDIIRRAGGRNIFADLDDTFGDVSFEQVAERRPEVIVIYDYGDTSVEQKKRFLLNSPVLADVPAIRNQRFAVLPLSSAVVGVRAPHAAADLAAQLHPDRFGGR